jgi:hypothetical protein
MVVAQRTCLVGPEAALPCHCYSVLGLLLLLLLVLLLLLLSLLLLLAPRAVSTVCGSAGPTNE